MIDPPHLWHLDPDRLLASFASPVGLARIELDDLDIETAATRPDERTYVFGADALPFDPRDLLRGTVDGRAVVDVETNMDPDGSTVTARTA